jgi:hypothetical protein
LLALLLWARDDARKEGIPLRARVFEDAATAAALTAGELRNIAAGKGTYAPGKKSLGEIRDELDELEGAGLSHEDALQLLFPPKRLQPREIGPCLVCIEDFVPGELAVKAPSKDQIGFAHLECLQVIIVEAEGASGVGAT